MHGFHDVITEIIRFNLFIRDPIRLWLNVCKYASHLHLNTDNFDQDWRNWIGLQTVLIGLAEIVSYWSSPQFVSVFLVLWLLTIVSYKHSELARVKLLSKVSFLSKTFCFKGFPSYQQCYYALFTPNKQNHFMSSTSIKYWCSWILLKRKETKM